MSYKVEKIADYMGAASGGLAIFMQDSRPQVRRGKKKILRLEKANAFVEAV